MGEAGETPWPRGAHTGGAWLSSARVVRCWVKSRNERNPRRVLPSGDAGTHAGPPPSRRRRGGRRQVIMPLMPWAAHVLQWPVQRDATPRGGRIPESRPQFGLGAATRPHEVGVASNRGSACRGECVPGPCHTARHTTRVVCTRSRRPNRKGGGAEGVEGEGVKS